MMEFAKTQIIDALRKTGECLDYVSQVEILLVGGAAGMVTDLLDPRRITLDCDVIEFDPGEADQAIIAAAKKVAIELDLSSDWLNCQVRQLDILPDGWQQRRQYVDTFCQLVVYSVGRLDLIAMKFYANRGQDREDIETMKPKRKELEFVKKYLNMLRLPRRQANLDQVQAALRYVDAIEEGLGDECF